MPEWIVPSEATLRRELFSSDAEGRRLVSPFGVRNLFLRPAWLVPSPDIEDRLIESFKFWRSIGVAVTFAFMILALTAIVMVFRAGAAATMQLNDWWIFLLALVMLLAPPYLSCWRALRSVGPLERAPNRTFEQGLAHGDVTRRATATGWVLTALVAFLIGANVAFGFEKVQAGRVGMGFVIIGSAMLLLPLLAVGPVTARMRRRREQNARLEVVVAERTAELEELNRTLEARVIDQVRDIERLGQLARFFSAPVAAMILDEKSGFDPLGVHRRELSVIAVDLRGFTAFSETAEPEEVIAVLRKYHAELGILVNRHGATVEHFAGDGALIFLNDPVEVADHPRAALQLAVGLREAMRSHLEEWRRMGFDLGLGIGVSVGYATVGAVGYEGRWEYAAIGSVCHLTEKLCSMAQDGQIVTTHRVTARAGEGVKLESLGELALKGFAKPVPAFNVLGAA